ncbi:MAG: hypothetical protein IJ828_04010, partial [Treponema sp.]|nr:hypothetical protein [Treponema sp.]
MKVITANEISKPSAAKRALALFTALLYLSCLAPAATYAAPPAQPALEQAAQTFAAATISAEKGGEVRLGKACIAIPAGALERDTEISITRLRKVEDTGENLDNATASGGGYRFLPAGQQFQKEVSITIPYDRTLNMRETALE